MTSRDIKNPILRDIKNKDPEYAQNYYHMIWNTIEGGIDTVLANPAETTAAVASSVILLI